jgi:hypothetical protein
MGHGGGGGRSAPGRGHRRRGKQRVAGIERGGGGDGVGAANRVGAYRRRKGRRQREEEGELGALGFGPREENGRGLKRGREERAAGARGKRSGGGHTGPASGRRGAPPRERPTGGCRGAGGAEAEADARARVRGRERGGRQVGPRGGEKKKGNGSTCKIKNMHLPSFKIHQNFTEARSHYQEYNSITNTQKDVKIAHNNSSKTAVFKLSKNFMARQRHPKIGEKYLKIII